MKKLLFLFLILTGLFLSREATAAVAHDASSAVQVFSGATSISWSHTASGSDRLAVVGIGGYSSMTVSSITYGGTGMTSVGSVTNTGNSKAFMYRLVAPSTGSQTISVGLGSGWGAAGSTSYTEVDQTTPMDTATTTTASVSQTVTVNVSSASGDMVVDVIGTVSTGDPVSPGAGQTERYESNDAQFGYGGGSSDEAGASTVTMSWTNSNLGAVWAQIAVNINASSGGPPPSSSSTPAVIMFE